MIFERSCGELSDVELQTAVTVVAARRDELAGTEPTLAAALADVLDVLVDERDRRRVLYREMTGAAARAVVQVVGEQS